MTTQQITFDTLAKAARLAGYELSQRQGHNPEAPTLYVVVPPDPGYISNDAPFAPDTNTSHAIDVLLRARGSISVTDRFVVALFGFKRAQVVHNGSPELAARRAIVLAAAAEWDRLQAANGEKEAA